MDRPIVYVGAVPEDTDILNTALGAMLSDGWLAQAILGTNTVFSGLTCTPNSPADMTVKVGPGVVFSQQNVDNSAYGSIEEDITHQVVKIGISKDTGSFSCPAPTTTGQSVVYLIQGVFSESDTGSTVLPYYNAANPTVPWSGPSGAGTSQNTIRQNLCVISIKAGTAATTGTQTVPSPDTGKTALWTVTVANGATTVISGNIALASGAPFIESLTSKISQATADARYAPLSGGRTKLSTNATVYISTSGNDSTGNGSSGSPFLTRQKAWNYIYDNYDLNRTNTVTIKMLDGNFNDNFVGAGTMIGQLSPSQVVFDGNDSASTNVTVTSSSGSVWGMSNGIGFTISNMVITASGNDCVQATAGGMIYLGAGITFGSSAGNHMTASVGGKIRVSSSYAITGGASSHFSAQDTGSYIFFAPSITVTITGTPTFVAYAAASLGGEVFVASPAMTISGSISGLQYSVSGSGLIASNGLTMPGASHSTATNGQYL